MTKNVEFKTLKELVETKNLTLRKISRKLDVNYNMVLKKSKTPQIGEVYNPELINWDEVENYLNDKEVNWKEFDWEEEIVEKVTINVEQDYKIGTEFTIRGSEHVHEVVYVTSKQIVVMEWVTNNVRLFSHNTFLHQTPKKLDR